MVEINPKPMFEWANERHRMYLRKQQGLYPLTADPILDAYKFCNVFRELDRVTKWIHDNIREPFKDHPDLWFMLATARTFNWPPTLKYLIENNQYSSWPSREAFTMDEMSRACDVLKNMTPKMYTGAYMIRAESDTTKPWYNEIKHHYICKVVLGRLWEDREDWKAMFETPNLTLQEVWKKFQQPRYIGWGAFMAYQVVVDLRHTRYLNNAPDINTWTAKGPGSGRGINRLLGKAPTAKLSQDQALDYMLQIYDVQDDYRAEWLPRIELSDIQNCLCETDKYLRVFNGEGRPRSYYVPESKF